MQLCGLASWNSSRQLVTPTTSWGRGCSYSPFTKAVVWASVEPSPLLGPEQPWQREWQVLFLFSPVWVSQCTVSLPSSEGSTETLRSQPTQKLSSVCGVLSRARQCSRHFIYPLMWWASFYRVYTWAHEAMSYTQERSQEALSLAPELRVLPLGSFDLTQLYSPHRPCMPIPQTRTKSGRDLEYEVMHRSCVNRKLICLVLCVLVINNAWQKQLRGLFGVTFWMFQSIIAGWWAWCSPQWPSVRHWLVTL